MGTLLGIFIPGILFLPQADPVRIEADIRKMVSFGTRHTGSSQDDPKRGIGAARRWVERELGAISTEFHEGRLQVTTHGHSFLGEPRFPGDGDVINVVAILPGSDPERLVVVSGHLDSRASDPMDAESDAPGANDDASGVAAVLESARILGDCRPRATLVFLVVEGEEQGLLGSRGEALSWKEEGRKIAGMFTLDIVGGAVGSAMQADPLALRVFSDGMPGSGRKPVGSYEDSSSRQLARYLRRAGEAAVPKFKITLIQRLDRFLRGGDHKPFHQAGWPAVRLTEPFENYAWQHQDVRKENGIQFGDLPEQVDFQYVARVTECVSAAAGELARAPAAPWRVEVDCRKLSPHTRLTWTPSPEKDLAGYAVLRRRTHEPDWTHRQVVPVDQVEIILEGVSKDDWLFGVEAFDKAGNRSLPVYPEPLFR